MDSRRKGNESLAETPGRVLGMTMGELRTALAGLTVGLPI
jgi:hypothetical protein